MKATWYDRQGPAAEVLVCGQLPDPESAVSPQTRHQRIATLVRTLDV